MTDQLLTYELREPRTAVEIRVPFTATGFRITRHGRTIEITSATATFQPDADHPSELAGGRIRSGVGVLVKKDGTPGEQHATLTTLGQLDLTDLPEDLADDLLRTARYAYQDLLDRADNDRVQGLRP